MNYQLELEKIIEKEIKTPKLLLHSCCGPCSSYVLDYLTNYFDITILYYNPNIYPQEEYQKRLEEQIKLINKISKKNKIKLLPIDYDGKKFYEHTKGLENELEGGKRCHICYRLRLEKTAKIAKEKEFDYFGTTLTVSPYKNAEVLNNIGKSLEKKYNIKYLYSDFKKKDGYKKSIELSKKYDLYRQNYCGCIYSLNQENKITMKIK